MSDHAGSDAASAERSEDGASDAEAADESLGPHSQDAYVLFIAGLTALLTALLAAASGEPTSVVLLANLAGLLGVGAAAREYVGRGEPDSRVHAAVAVVAGAGAVLSIGASWLTAALLALVALMSLGRIRELYFEE